MTVSSSTNKVSYSGNGTTTTFPYTFKIFNDSDLLVILRDTNGKETTQVLNTDYTVSGAGDDDGGNVEMITAPATGETLVIVRSLDFLQETDYPPNDPFPAEAHEDALDKLTMMVQQIKEVTDRSFTYPISYSGGASQEMPEPQADAVIGWKSDGSGLENKTSIGETLVSEFGAELVAAADAQAVIDLLGIVITSFGASLLQCANVNELAAISDLPGVIKMYGGATAPDGWLLCDGASYLRSNYPDLFNVIGTTYGAADSSHFNVPDLRGRVPIGAGTGTGGGSSGTGLPTGGSSLTAISLGTWKGAETHALTTSEIPSHNHGVNDSGHSHSIQVGGSANIVDKYCIGDGNRTLGYQSVDSSTTGITIQNTGGGSAHNNIQPVMGVNFIIKT